MSNPEVGRRSCPNEQALMRAKDSASMPKRGPRVAESRGKASPEQVIGKSKPMGRLNKRLILGVVGALGVGLLVLNFLPSGKGAKQANSDGSPVYANDVMPQDVKEMALKMPEASPTSAATTSSASGYQGPANVGNPFVGYPGSYRWKHFRIPRYRGGFHKLATRDYQGAAAAEAKVEAEAAARRAPMEVATKLTAGLTTGASAQINSSTGQSSSDRTSNPAAVTAAAPGTQPQNLVGGALSQASYTPGRYTAISTTSRVRPRFLRHRRSPRRRTSDDRRTRHFCPTPFSQARLSLRHLKQPSTRTCLATSGNGI